MLTGTVRKWISDRWFGFIQRDDGTGDLFCHIREVNGRLDELRPGQRVRFEEGTEKDTEALCSACGGSVMSDNMIQILCRVQQEPAAVVVEIDVGPDALEALPSIEELGVSSEILAAAEALAICCC